MPNPIHQFPTSFQSLLSLILLTTILSLTLLTSHHYHPYAKPTLEGLPLTLQVGPAESTFHTYFHGSFPCGISGCTTAMTMSLNAIISPKPETLPPAAMLLISFYRGGTYLSPYIPAHNSVFKLLDNGMTLKRPFSTEEVFLVAPGETLHFYGEIVYTNASSVDLSSLAPLNYSFEFAQTTHTMDYLEFNDNNDENEKENKNDNNLQFNTNDVTMDILSTNTNQQQRRNAVKKELSWSVTVNPTIYTSKESMNHISSQLYNIHQTYTQQTSHNNKQQFENGDIQQRDDYDIKQQLNQNELELQQLTSKQREYDISLYENDLDKHNELYSQHELILQQQSQPSQQQQLQPQQFHDDNSSWNQVMSLSKPVLFYNQTTPGEHYGVYIDGIRLLDDYNIDETYDASRYHLIQIRLSHIRRAFNSFELKLIGDVEFYDFSSASVTRIKCSTDYQREFSLQYVDKKTIIGNIEIQQDATITLQCPELKFQVTNNYTRAIFASFIIKPQQHTKERYGTIVPVMTTAQRLRRIPFGTINSASSMIFLEPLGYDIDPTIFPTTSLSSVTCRFQIDFKQSPSTTEPWTQSDVKIAKEKFKVFIINAQPISPSYLTVTESNGGLRNYKMSKDATQGADTDPFIFYEPFQVSNNLTTIMSEKYYVHIYIPILNSSSVSKARSIQCQLWYESLSLETTLYPKGSKQLYPKGSKQSVNMYHNDNNEQFNNNEQYNNNEQFHNDQNGVEEHRNGIEHEPKYTTTLINTLDPTQNQHLPFTVTLLDVNAQPLIQNDQNESQQQYQQQQQYSSLNTNFDSIQSQYKYHFDQEDQYDHEFMQFAQNYIQQQTHYQHPKIPSSYKNNIIHFDPTLSLQYEDDIYDNDDTIITSTITNNSDNNNNNVQNIIQQQQQQNNNTTFIPLAGPLPSRRTTYSIISKINTASIFSRQDGRFFEFPTKARTSWKWTQYDALKPPPIDNKKKKVTILGIGDNDENGQNVDQVVNDEKQYVISKSIWDQLYTYMPISIQSYMNHYEQYHILTQHIIQDTFTSLATSILPTTFTESFTTQSISNYYRDGYYQDPYHCNYPIQNDIIYPHITTIGDYTIYYNPITNEYSIRELAYENDHTNNHNNNNNLNNNHHNNTTNTIIHSQFESTSLLLSSSSTTTATTTTHMNTTSTITNLNANYNPKRPKKDTMESIFFLDPIITDLSNTDSTSFFKTEFHFPILDKPFKELYITFSMHTYVFLYNGLTNGTTCLVNDRLLSFEMIDAGHNNITFKEGGKKILFPILKFSKVDFLLNSAVIIQCNGILIYSQTRDNVIPRIDNDYYFHSDSNRVVVYGLDYDTHRIEHIYAQQIPFKHFIIITTSTTTIILIVLAAVLAGLVILLFLLRLLCCREQRGMNKKRRQRRKDNKNKNGTHDEDDDFFIRLDSNNNNPNNNNSSGNNNQDNNFNPMGDNDLW